MCNLDVAKTKRRDVTRKNDVPKHTHRMYIIIQQLCSHTHRLWLRHNVHHHDDDNAMMFNLSSFITRTQYMALALPLRAWWERIQCLLRSNFISISVLLLSLIDCWLIQDNHIMFDEARPQARTLSQKLCRKIMKLHSSRGFVVRLARYRNNYMHVHVFRPSIQQEYLNKYLTICTRSRLYWNTHLRTINLITRHACIPKNVQSAYARAQCFPYVLRRLLLNIKNDHGKRTICRLLRKNITVAIIYDPTVHIVITIFLTPSYTYTYIPFTISTDDSSMYET